MKQWLRKKYLVITALGIALLVVGTVYVFAAGPRARGKPFGGKGLGEWWASPKVKEKLELSDEQVEKLKSTHRECQTKRIQLEADKKILELKLRDLFQQEELPEKEITKTIKELGEVQQKLFVLPYQTRLETSKILQPEQRQKVKNFMGKRQEQRREKIKKFRQTRAGLREEYRKECPYAQPPKPGQVPEHPMGQERHHGWNHGDWGNFKSTWEKEPVQTELE